MLPAVFSYIYYIRAGLIAEGGRFMKKKLFFLGNSVKNISRYRSKYLLFGILYFIAICAFSVLLNMFLYIDKSVEALKMQHFATVMIRSGAIGIPLDEVLRNFDEEDFYAYRNSRYVDKVAVLSYRFSTYMMVTTPKGALEPMTMSKNTSVTLNAGGKTKELRDDNLLKNPVYVLGLNFEALKERGKINESNFIIEKGRMYENDDECVIGVSSQIADAEWNSLDIGDTVTITSDSVSTGESISKEYVVVGILRESETLTFYETQYGSPQTRMLYTTLNSAVSLKDLIVNYYINSSIKNVSIDISGITEDINAGIIRKTLEGFEVWVDLQSYNDFSSFQADARLDGYYAERLIPHEISRPLWNSFNDSRDWSLAYMYTIIIFIVSLTIVLTILLLNSRKYEIAVLRSVGMKKSRLILGYLTENLAFVWGMAAAALVSAQAIYYLFLAQGVTGGIDEKFMPDSPLPVLLQNIGITFGGITAVAALSLVFAVVYIVRFEPLKIFNKQY